MVELAPPWEEVLFAWLHVSDIHFGHGDATHGWNQELVLEMLLRDVGQLLQEGRAPWPAAILVTGDVAFSGATRSKDEYVGAARWLTDLAEQARLDASKVFLVPGNHDVQRCADQQDPHVRRLVQLLRSGAEPLDDCLGRPSDVALLSSRLANYLEFARGFGPPRGGAALAAAPSGWSHKLRVKGLDVRLVGLDTACLAADDGDRGKLRLGTAQLAHALLERDAGPTVTILLSHHPFRGGWLADEALVASWVRSHAHVHLSGHVHVANAEQVISGGGSSIIHVAAGAAHGEADAVPTSHGYSFGALVRSKDGEVGLALWPRRWSAENAGFRVDVANAVDGTEGSIHTLRPLSAAPREQQGGMRATAQQLTSVPMADERVPRGAHSAGDSYLSDDPSRLKDERTVSAGSARRWRPLWAALALGAASVATAVSVSLLRAPATSAPPPLVRERAALHAPAGIAAPPQAGESAGKASKEIGSPPPAMLRIPGARFAMGVSSEQDFRRWCLGQGGKLPDCNELLGRISSRQVQVETFDLDRTEVTAGAFAGWLNGQLESQAAQETSGGRVRLSTGEPLAHPDCHGAGGLLIVDGKVVPSPEAVRRPAVCVSFTAAASFCEAAGKRLPTDEEWELAAGGTEKRWLAWDPSGSRRPSCNGAIFGRRRDGACNAEPHGPASVDAAREDVTPEGVLQLSGNVSEWVRPAVAEAPPKPRQLVRGGSWSGLAIDLHPAKLMFLNADETEAANVGFRCARSVGREGENR